MSSSISDQVFQHHLIQMNAIVDHYHKEFMSDIVETTQSLHEMAKNNNREGLLKLKSDRSVAVVKVRDDNKKADLVFAFHQTKMKEKLEMYANCGERKNELTRYQDKTNTIILTQLFFEKFAEKDAVLGKILAQSDEVRSALSLLTLHIQEQSLKFVNETSSHQRYTYKHASPSSTPAKNVQNSKKNGSCSVQ